MTTTPVGMRCPECSRERTKVVQVRAGGIVSIPRVTYALIAINVIAFLAEQGQFSLSGSSIHGRVINEGVLFRGGIVEGQYWRLASSAFLHENLLHIGFNMYLLYLLGMMLEPAMGALRFASVYLTAMLTGALGALIATADPSLGASGAVFGLMGAAVVELRARQISVMQSGIGGLIIINLIFSVAIPNISIGDHIGGLIGGAVAGLAIRAADQRKVSALGFVACLLLCGGAVLAAIAVSGVSGTGFA